MLEYTNPGGGCGCGCRGPRWGTRPSRAAVISELEERQRDLEQEAADVADTIRRLREEGAPKGSTAKA